MERDIYDEDHEAFRDVVKEFVKRYATEEKRKQWEADGEIDRATMLAAGEAGIIGLSVPEEFGGAGMLQDYRFRSIVLEETIGAGQGSLAGAFGIQDDLAVPYIVHMGTQEQKEKWLPGMATGEILGALAMTEPGAGSDLRGIKTTAKKVDGGYLVNGAKTFISSGKTADMVVTFVKTGEEPAGCLQPADPRGRHGGLRPQQEAREDGLPRVGHRRAQLHRRVRPRGEPHRRQGGPRLHPAHDEPAARALSIGVAAAAGEAAFAWTRDYVLSREAFGERIADFQNTRFLLADMATTVDVMWTYNDRAMMLYKDKKLTAEEAAKVKFWSTDREAELLDIGVQLHGGYGYITEYPIARAYLDARVHRIYGGTNEIMRDIVSRQIVGKR
jgi:long-chain-acyl-CoA dehydrogenase